MVRTRRATTSRDNEASCPAADSPAKEVNKVTMPFSPKRRSAHKQKVVSGSDTTGTTTTTTTTKTPPDDHATDEVPTETPPPQPRSTTGTATNVSPCSRDGDEKSTKTTTKTSKESRIELSKSGTTGEATTTTMTTMTPSINETSPHYHTTKKHKRKQQQQQQHKSSKKKRTKGERSSVEKELVANEDTIIITTKPEPSMDVLVHRLRHVHYQPRPILCLATTPHSSVGGSSSDYVAVSRDNGNVELKCPDEKWRTVATITGKTTRTVDVMAWICGSSGSSGDGVYDDATENENQSQQQQQQQQQQDNRDASMFSSSFHESHTTTHARRTLFGASRDGSIFILNFAHGQLMAVTGSGGGGVFSLTSLCGTTNNNACCQKCPQLVAAGCQDGSIRIFRLPNKVNTNKLELVSTIPCAGTAILSLAWHMPEQQQQQVGMAGSVLYAGVADGTIRRLDCLSTLTTIASTGLMAARSTGKVLVTNDDEPTQHLKWKSTLRMTVESYGRATPTRVWALRALRDGTIVSGDSLGHVQLWDGTTGTLLQSFDQNDTKADVLSLAVSDNECRIFASGIDSRVILLQRPETTPNSSSSSSSNTVAPKWVLTHAQRPHTHDVKSMVICKQRDSSGCFQKGEYETEILCSGGVDTKFCTYNVKDFGKFRPKSLYPWPCVSPISVANEARILIMRRDKQIDLYKLAPPASAANDVMNGPVLVQEDKTLIGTIQVEGKCNQTCADIASDGRSLVVSNASGLIVFRVNHDIVNGKEDHSHVQFTKIDIPRSLRIPCLAVKFVSDSRYACATHDGRILLFSIENGDPASVTLLHSFPAASTGALFAIHSLRVSPDGAWLSAERSGVERGTVRVLNISDGAFADWWSLPALEAPVTSTRFLSGEKSSLLAVSCANCALYVFDVVERKLCSWSEKFGVPMGNSLPRELQFRADFPVRIASNPATPNLLLLGFFGAFSAIDMTKSMPRHCRVFPETHVRGNKTKHEVTSHNGTAVEGDSSIKCENNCTICLRYNSMLYMDFIDRNEMLVVEQPWLNVVASFPEALERKVYGT